MQLDGEALYAAYCKDIQEEHVRKFKERLEQNRKRDYDSVSREIEPLVD